MRTVQDAIHLQQSQNLLIVADRRSNGGQQTEIPLNAKTPFYYFEGGLRFLYKNLTFTFTRYFLLYRQSET
jgi:hypothetical protein